MYLGYGAYHKLRLSKASNLEAFIVHNTTSTTTSITTTLRTTMPTTEEGVHRIGDHELYTKSWLPDQPALAKLIFIHGFNDHINRYYDLFPSLAARGISVHGFDQRGWGQSVKSSSHAGLTGPTPLVISDIVSFIETHLPSPIPVFAMGHSMGGGEAMILASSPEHQELTASIRGWILESPFIAFPKGFEPSSVTVFFGRLAGRLLPRMKKLAPLPPENLSRDPAVVASLKEDKLLHDTGTLEGLSGMLDRTAALSQGKTTLNKGVRSLWLGHGTKDMGTCYEASRKWFEQQRDVEDKEFKSYEGWYHQLHADLPDNRDVFAKDVGDWVLARVGEGDVGVKPSSKL
ncbi:hypothetical protein HYALB_00010076 [Hymenoscyphus albidus]|uniref:Serine aminopeptidase S33 domain-containing protein n=1 Tax=Hymenoscyphus albidus TaxID=595503 RepID=A0A9N9LU01_9HELO|nr:hypothetical protein HYALB_00010076 [Hymenoscyphus albidus]